MGAKIYFPEILLGLLFDFMLCFDPVKQFPSFLFVFGVGGLVLFRSFFKLIFFFEGGL